MLPIAVLPIAGLLLRFGQPDLLNLSFIAAAGDAIFSNLGLLFAIGVAGVRAEDNGAAGLAGAVCFLVASKGASASDAGAARRWPACPTPRKSGAGLALQGQGDRQILGADRHHLGLIGGNLLQSLHTMKLPDYLAFFAGRRFVPIVAASPAWFWPAFSAALQWLRPRHRQRSAASSRSAGRSA